MRNLSENALAKIAGRYGVEPITVVEVQWTKNGSPVLYGDKTVSPVEGKILEVSRLDSVVDGSSVAETQSLTVVLDDTAGTIKSIMDQSDIHMRDVWVWQWFTGLDWADRFLLFKGKINTPIVWNEGDRTVRFDVVSQIESREIGFSAEAGEFEYIPEQLVGEPWPMVFGTSVLSKTLRLTQRATGATVDGVAIRDASLELRIAALRRSMYRVDRDQAEALARAERARNTGNATQVEQYQRLANANLSYGHGLAADYVNANTALTRQKATETMSFRVHNGESFPRDQILLEVGGAIFYGSFVGNTFHIYQGRVGGFLSPYYNLPEPIRAVADFQTGFVPTEPTPGVYYPTGVPAEFLASIVNRAAVNPAFIANPHHLFPYAEGTIVRYRSGVGEESAGVGPESTYVKDRVRWEPNRNIIGDDLGYFFAAPGTQVSMRQPEPQKFVVSITPGTVLRVMAYATYGSQQYLLDVPSDKYTVAVEHFGSVAATVITLHDDLSKDATTQWGSDLYVTFQSSIGPNMADIIAYLVTTFTDFTVDEASFTKVHGQIERFPANFTLCERRDALSVLKEITWQARCALRIVNGVVYLVYLPDSPTAVASVSEDDVDAGTLEVSHTNSDDLVTKMVCVWRATGAQPDDHQLILRHNVGRYGVHERSFQFYIYNSKELVEHAALFWLIRYANTWKRVSFKTPLHLLNVEPFDPMELAFTQPYLADEPVVGLVEQAEYSSADHTIAFEVWTPVRAGTMGLHVFAYPAVANSTLEFPTPEDLLYEPDGFGRDATGTLDQERIDLVNRVTYPYSFEILAPSSPSKLAPSDLAKRNPGVPTMPLPPLPSLNSTPAASTPMLTVRPPESILATMATGSSGTIDIRNTSIYDSSTGRATKFSTFFAGITTTGKLAMATTALLSNGEQVAAFDYKYSSTYECFAAGTAYLR